MKKDLDKGNWIIPPWDFRYGKLGHMWNRLTWDKCRLLNGQSTLMLLPKELCKYSIDRWTGRGNHLLFNSSIDLIVNSNSYSRLLEETCDLTTQEYFDLLNLKINNIQNRRRCMLCHCMLNFHHQLNHNYGWFCNSSHSEIFMQSHPEYSPDTAAHKISNYATTDSRILSTYRSALSNGSPDEIISFYIAEVDNGYKYGIARDINVRLSYSRLDGWNYKNIKSLLNNRRDLICKLEYLIKLKLKSEFIESNNLDKFYELFNKYRLTLDI